MLPQGQSYTSALPLSSSAAKLPAPISCIICRRLGFISWWQHWLHLVLWVLLWLDLGRPRSKHRHKMVVCPSLWTILWYALILSAILHWWGFLQEYLQYRIAFLILGVVAKCSTFSLEMRHHSKLQRKHPFQAHAGDLRQKTVLHF